MATNYAKAKAELELAKHAFEQALKHIALAKANSGDEQFHFDSITEQLKIATDKLGGKFP